MRISIAIWILLLGFSWPGQTAETPSAQVIASRSGQFVVRGLSGSLRTSSLTLTSGVEMIRLEPAVLAVSCEQVKEAVLKELKVPDKWRGRIQLSLRLDPGPIRMISHRFQDGWSYRLELPEQVDGSLFYRTLVEVILCELANRRPGPNPAQPPLWLAEGLASHLQAITPGSLTLKAETRSSRRVSKGNPLRDVRSCLQTNRALTATELSWPREENLLGDRAAFRACSQLLLYRLLELKDGPECLRQMIEYLPNYLNWQSAFLHAFRHHFADLMALDKWWALHLVSFLGREEMFRWSGDETLAQLQHILRVPVQVRMTTQDLPLYTDVPLQSVISEWAYGEQIGVLRQRLNLLQALRLRALPRYVELLDGYAATLTQYLDKRRDNLESRALPSVARQALRQLNGLDLQRQAFHRAAADPSLAEQRVETGD